MLDIIVTHYDEPWEIVKPFFDMLDAQRLCDFSQVRVRIVHDGTKAFPKSYFSHMPVEVIQNTIPHKGVSAARNYGIDHSNAKWIMFCDCDDAFSSIYALKLILDVMHTEDYDVLWNEFIMEVGEKHGITIHTKKGFNLVWIHNKYYRMSFLKENNFRFNEDLYMSEDSAFNAVIGLHIPPERIGHIKSPMPLYIWAYRNGSVTLDPKNTLRNMIGHYERNLYVLDEFRKCDHPDADAMTARVMTDAYVNLTRDELPDGCEVFEKRVRAFIRENAEILNRLPKERFDSVLKASEREAFSGGFLGRNRPDVHTWLRTIFRCKSQ